MALATSVAAQGNHTNGGQIDVLSRTLRESPFLFLQPTLALQQAALEAAKTLLDPLTTEVAAAQVARRTENRRKRKRGGHEVEDPVLQLRQIYTKDLDVNQVWEQAKRVLDAASDEVEREIQLHAVDGNALNRIDGQNIEDGKKRDDSDDSDNLLQPNDQLEDVGIDEEEYSAEGVPSDEDIEDIENIEDDSDIMESSDVEEAEEQDSRPQEIFVQDPNNLNDGFFSIDDFNKQSQFLEHMDAQGEIDERSDEDEIDWTVNPLSQTLQKPRSDREQGLDDTDTEEDTEDGPTFGNANLNDMDSDEGLDEIDEGDLVGDMMGSANTNEIRYADFFEPPPPKPSKNKRMRALPKTQPPAFDGSLQHRDNEETQDDLQRAIADVRRDLLDSEEENASEEDDEGASLGDKHKSLRVARKIKDLSTHEKQKAEIAQEIRRLEAANVAKKDWTLSGEASGHARPLNSLLDEGGNLEFERVGKPVPVITAEVSEDIEALIKRRILAREFDEVLRRRPTAVGDAAHTRRGRVELDDTKPVGGLGEIYEQEHLRQSDPSAYVDKRSSVTKKQHEEIDHLWNEVRDQLDILGNLHFKPKRLNIEIKTIEDKPRIAMEDARPAATDGDIDGNGMLAPQEVYKPGTEGRSTNGEIMVEQTGASRSKEEMTREEKIRRRRREKTRLKKAQGNKALVHLNGEKSVRKGKSQEKQKVLDDLKRGGVKIIGKGGEMQDLASKKKRKDRTLNQAREVGSEGGSSSALKL